MSRRYVFVKLDDGMFHRGCVLGGDGWFLCFDESEPPELVIKIEKFKQGLTPAKIINENELAVSGISKARSFTGRCFPEGDKDQFVPAIAFFLRISRPPPAKLIIEQDAVRDPALPLDEGTFWTFETNKKEESSDDRKTRNHRIPV